MLNSIAFFLLFETLEPSYATLTSLLPAQVMASAISSMDAPSLSSPKIPINRQQSIGPALEAKSVFSIDLTSGSPLFTKDIFSRRQIGSIEKLVTAMVILDNHDLAETVTVSRNAAMQEGSRMWLAPDEKITVENLLTGMLVNSGNDAAIALAEFNSGTEKSFVQKMNRKTAELGLRNTHFSNAKGFDDAENYSTAFDIISFSKAALEYPFIREKAKIKNGELSSVNGNTKHKLENTNELLSDPHFKVTGLKTGKTPAAGESFVSLTEGHNQHEILSVVLDSPNRFQETKILLDWIFRNFDFP